MSDSYSGADRRRSPRLDLSIPVKVSVAESGATVTGITVNLSMTGLYVLLDEAIKDFDEVEISLSLEVAVPEGGRESFAIALPGVTVRVEDTQSRFAVAFMFRKLPVEAEWVVGKFLLEEFNKLLAGGSQAADGDA